jgi:hypothetical protein
MIEAEHGGIIIKDTIFLDALDGLRRIIDKCSAVHGAAVKSIADRYRDRGTVSRSQHQQALKIVNRYHKEISEVPEFAPRINTILQTASSDERKMEQLASIQKSVTGTGNVEYLD